MLINLIVLSGYTQTLSDTVKCYNKKELRAISEALINGSECCGLLSKSNKEIKLLEENVMEVESKFTMCDSTLNKINEDNKLLQKENVLTNSKLEKELKRKRFWRTFAASSTGVVVILITILTLK